MTSEAFAASVLAWHDFYIAVADATAALLGLLFVAVSIRFANVSERRPEQRARAVSVFGNLLSALVLSLVVLIPGQDARSIALQLGLIATLSGIRVVRSAARLRESRSIRKVAVATLRRLGWTAFAVLMLAYSAIGLWSTGDANYLYALLAAAFVFLIGAADVSWELLIHEAPEG